MNPGWALVVPVKGSTGKSRLEHPDRAALATAIALDTLESVCRARKVQEVVVVTSDEQIARAFATECRPDGSATTFAGGSMRIRVVDDPRAGLNAAIAAGIAVLDAGAPRAALLGDLPALDPGDLDAALDTAAAHARAFAPDAEGTGTTLITAIGGEPLEPAFGGASAARHAAAGFARLGIPVASTLRRDVDTVVQLRAAAALGLGPRTAALL